VAAAGYAALPVVLTWPLASQITAVLPHDLGDPLLSTTTLWWNAHVMPLTARWWDGFAFFPASGTIALSDHRLGESLLATPLQWAGASAVTAYNLTLLATFPLCALAAYWLGFVLTGRHDAAFLCGLAYGFTPYRMAHIGHLELLAAFGMPAALAALHRYDCTRQRRWLAAFTAALTLQTLCSSYYALFFVIVLALWMVWFLRWTDWRAAIGILIACTCAVIVVAPIGVGYWRLHAQQALSRTFIEIQTYSADLSSFVTASPLMALWGWTAAWNGPELQLFPGITPVLLAASGLFVRRRRAAGGRDRIGRAALWLTAVSIAFLTVALGVIWIGPWSIRVMGLAASSRDAFKPLTISLMALTIAVACHPALRDAFRRRSTYAFYVLATIALLVLSLGPTPSFLGAQFLYRPPYSWLMHLPFFADGIRAPARFAMPAVLTLSAAATLAYARLASSSARQNLLLPLAAAALVADTWIRGLALPPVPAPLPGVPSDVVAVLTVPFGDAEQEAAAVYRTVQAGHTAVNGMSGYDPLHYAVLRLALTEGDSEALDVVAERGPLLLAVDKHADLKAGWIAFVAGQRGIARVSEDARWALFRLPKRDPPPPIAAGPRIPIVAIQDDRQVVDRRLLVDDDHTTGWFRTDVQFPGETLQVDIGRAERLGSIEMSLGRNGETYPRLLSIATSIDGEQWTPAYSGRTGAQAYRAALANPRDVRLTFRLGGTEARFIRLRLEPAPWTPMPWFVTELAVMGAGAIAAR
jgi:hypothetical protein